jgi:ribosome-binding protein aMBF1 (putative translation factor)
MPKPPRYQLRCAQFCQDARGNYRDGVEWVHIYGRTLWVCGSCADELGKGAGIKTTSQKRRETRQREDRQQLRFEA